VANPNGAIERERSNAKGGIRDTVAAESVSHLKSLEHADLTLTGYRDCSRRFCEWLRCSGIAIDAIDDDVVDRSARRPGKWRGHWHNR
jgi:hypothetical protein